MRVWYDVLPRNEFVNFEVSFTYGRTDRERKKNVKETPKMGEDQGENVFGGLRRRKKGGVTRNYL